MNMTEVKEAARRVCNGLGMGAGHCPWQHEDYQSSEPPTPRLRYIADCELIAAFFVKHRLDSFLELLERRAKELAPDYPHVVMGEDDFAFDHLWSITASLEGTDKACDDLHKVLRKARPDLYEGTTEASEKWKAETSI